jgi:arginase
MSSGSIQAAKAKESSMPQYAIIEAPSILGLRPTGVENLPAALLAVGLADRLKARRAARVEAPAHSPQRDRETRMLNPCGIAAYSVALADAVSDVLDRGEFPVVLGGDCSILLGNLLALRRRPGRSASFSSTGIPISTSPRPEAEPNGEAASMDLALATGRGPTVVTNLEGLRPLVRDEDVVA